MSEPAAKPPRDDLDDGRWPFVRDVIILQFKLMLGNLHNFVLIPATLAAAAIDLVFKSERHGSRFYRVLDWGRRAEEAIGLYSALDDLRPGGKGDAGPSSGYTAKPPLLPPAQDLP
jgi:hypothetical protein